MHKIRIIAIALCMLQATGLYAQNREVTVLRTDWKFFLGENEGAQQRDFDDSEWKVVNVPHDWAIEQPFIEDGDGNTGKLPWKGQGWYRKSLNIPETYAGKQVYLLFDGVMAFPKVYVNGELAGSWDYGYNSFYLDITDFIDVNGENILAVHADTRPHDSRWYPGAGIYRKVRLIAVNPVHVDIWGLHVTTPIVKPHYADIRAAVTVNTKGKYGEKNKVKYAEMDDN